MMREQNQLLRRDGHVIHLIVFPRIEDFVAVGSQRAVGGGGRHRLNLEPRQFLSKGEMTMFPFFISSRIFVSVRIMD